MKSTEEQLAKRGFLSDSLYQVCRPQSEGQLNDHIESRVPTDRTLAVRTIRQDKHASYIPQLTDMLQREDKLYTKIELCECLAEFGMKALPYLIPLLGKIGNNQHKRIALVDLAKKSYPLPRDIVARIIIRIGPEALPDLRTVLNSPDRDAKLEAIDAIGHISYTFKDDTAENDLTRIYFAEPDDELVTWKLIRSFQAFTSLRIAGILHGVIGSESAHSILRKEASRSLARISEQSLSRCNK